MSIIEFMIKTMK